MCNALCKLDVNYTYRKVPGITLTGYHCDGKVGSVSCHCNVCADL
jgi:small ligand-binding sensory domain FIST